MYYVQYSEEHKTFDKTQFQIALEKIEERIEKKSYTQLMHLIDIIKWESIALMERWDGSIGYNTVMVNLFGHGENCLLSVYIDPVDFEILFD